MLPTIHHADRRRKPLSSWLEGMAAPAALAFAAVAVPAALARLFPAEWFQGYLMAQRVIAVASPVATLCLAGALAKAVAASTARPLRQKRLLAGSLVLSMPAALAVLAAGWLAPPAPAVLFPALPPDEETRLWKAISLWLASSTGYSLLRGYYCGILNTRLANAVGVAANVLAPAVIIPGLWLAESLSLSNLLSLWAVAYALAFADCAGRASKAFRQLPRSVAEAWEAAAADGFPRVPDGVMAALPAFAIPCAMGLSGADPSPFLSGLLAVQAFQALVDPMRGGLPPHVLLDARGGQKPRLTDVCRRVFEFYPQAALLSAGWLVAWGPGVAGLWFGAGREASGEAVRHLAASLVPAMLYPPTRQVLERLGRGSTAAWNLAAGALAGVAAAALLAWRGALSPVAACWVFTGFLAVAVGLNAVAISARVSFKQDWGALAECAVVCGVLGMASFGVAWLCALAAAPLTIALGMAISAVGSLAAFAGWAFWRQCPWMLFVAERLGVISSGASTR